MPIFIYSLDLCERTNTALVCDRFFSGFIIDGDTLNVDARCTGR